MGNPILEQMNKAGQNVSNPASQNGSSGPLPTSMDDPRMSATKDYVSKHGGNPKAAFYMLCKERGITNPATWINQILGGGR